MKYFIILFSLWLTPSYAGSTIGNVSINIVEAPATMNSDGTHSGSEPLYCETAENGDITCYF